MGTIYERGDFQYQVKIRRRGYPTQTKTFRSKKEAEIWARQVESEMDRGLFVSRQGSGKHDAGRGSESLRV